MVTRNINIEQSATMTAAAVQQQSDPSIMIELTRQVQKAMGQIADAMETMTEQKEEIAELRKQVSTSLEEEQQRQKQDIENTLKERDEKLIKEIREIQETRLQLNSSKEEQKNGGSSGNRDRKG